MEKIWDGFEEDEPLLEKVDSRFEDTVEDYMLIGLDPEASAKDVESF